MNSPVTPGCTHHVGQCSACPHHLKLHVRQCNAHYCEQVNHCQQKPVPFCAYCFKEKDCCSFVYYRYLWRLSRRNPEPEVHLISAFWPSLPSHLDAAYEAHSKDTVFIFKGKNCIIFFCFAEIKLTVRPSKYEFSPLY